MCVQAAVHDALNAIKPRYAAYYFEGPAAAGTAPKWRLLRRRAPC